MTKIYLIRHAEAEGNLYRRIQGHYDGGLTPLGKGQVAALSKRFENIHLDAVYSSDLYRASATAAAVAEHLSLPVVTTERLREIDVGAWEDVPWGNVEHDDPDQIYNFSSDPENWHVDGSESFGHLVQRIRSAIREIAEKHDGQTVAVVSHGMAIRSFLFSLMDLPPSEIVKLRHGDNTSVSLLDYENGKFTIEYRNDNSHLPSELSTFAKQTWWKEDSGKDKNNLRLIPLDLDTESDYYIQCYESTWLSAHGSLDGFAPAPYAAAAADHHRAHPLAIMELLRYDERVGLIELDVEHLDEGTNSGWITLCYISEECRGHQYGLQLIGHAVSLYRRLGRSSLRLSVSTDNESALRFYRRWEFREVGRREGALVPLIIMEKQI